MAICLVEGCELKVLARGWCVRHYNRWRNNGDPLGGRYPKTKQEAFDDQVDRHGPNGCWIWKGSSAHGYGVMRVEHSRVLAHRYSYEVHRGPIPEGLELDHLCRTPACVNPEHLEPVTHAENMRRARRTHCRKGHSMADAYQRSDGSRRCRGCYAEARARKREVACR